MSGTDADRVEVEPALTPEEWDRLQARAFDLEEQWRAFGNVVATFLGGPAGASLLSRNLSERRRAASAIALFGAGPDGGPLFTLAMVDAIRRAAAMLDAKDPAGADLVEATAARLTSILPPE